MIIRDKKKVIHADCMKKKEELFCARWILQYFISFLFFAIFYFNISFSKYRDDTLLRLKSTSNSKERQLHVFSMFPETLTSKDAINVLPSQELTSLNTCYHWKRENVKFYIYFLNLYNGHALSQDMWLSHMWLKKSWILVETKSEKYAKFNSFPF